MCAKELYCKVKKRRSHNRKSSARHILPCALLFVHISFINPCYNYDIIQYRKRTRTGHRQRLYRLKRPERRLCVRPLRGLRQHSFVKPNTIDHKGLLPPFFGKKRLYGSIPPSLRCFIYFRLQTGGSIPIPLDGWHNENCRADPADGTDGQYTAPDRR